MSARTIRPGPPAPEEAAAPLKEILHAMTGEFARACAARDLEEAAWRQIYRENPNLAPFEPCRIRIVEAKVSLPVALHQVATPSASPTGQPPEFRDPNLASLPLAPESRFLYRAGDLEKLRPEVILRLDLTLTLD